MRLHEPDDRVHNRDSLRCVINEIDMVLFSQVYVSLSSHSSTIIKGKSLRMHQAFRFTESEERTHHTPSQARGNLRT